MAVYKTTAYETRRWTFDIMYKTTFDAGEGEVETTSRRYAAGKPYGSFPKAVREGWWFLEWRDEDGNAVKPRDLVEGPRALTAVWSDVPTYTALEWIENAGIGAYIDTGFAPNDDTTVEIEYSTQSVTNAWAVLFGCTPNDNSPNSVLLRFYNTNNQLNPWFGQPSYGSPTVSHTHNVRHTVVLKKGSMTFDGAVSSIASNTVNQSASIYVFGGNFPDSTEGNSPWRGQKMKLYGFKIWDGDQLALDLIPALDPDRTVCLYDAVSDGFLYNAGTQSFTAGPEA